MRLLLSLVILLGVTYGITLVAQTMTRQNLEVPSELLGVYVAPIYVAIPDVIQPDVFPFTAAGKQAFDDYDVFLQADNQEDDCVMESMPSVLFTGDPMEISHENNKIFIHYERTNAVRTIYLDSASHQFQEQHPTGLGFSVGSWTGDEFWIETTHMEEGVIRSNRPYPISEQGRISERYWLDSIDNKLHMELVVYDPQNYTHSVTFGRHWIPSKQDEVRSWDCISLGPRHSEPDIDELARMLEEL
ncbi:MAG: hypothetical protein CMM56_03080 [Rhodospirillaceae bacterium]|nr:hypothetical protein [Rhodospirillaceae bacterium]|tara:strand:- start:271 stop:1005 length:735 start_codon:yes stop_codon:yes gene_type:complete